MKDSKRELRQDLKSIESDPIDIVVVPVVPVVLLCLLALLVGYWVVSRYWLNETERIFVDAFGGRGSSQVLPAEKIIRDVSFSSGGVVCALGPYQDELREYKTDFGMVTFDKGIPLKIIKKINAYLKRNGIYSGENEWHLIVAMHERIEVIQISRSHVEFMGGSSGNRTCVPYARAGFEQVTTGSNTYAVAVKLINTGDI